MNPRTDPDRRQPCDAPAESDGLVTRSSLLGRLRDLNDNASWRDFFETYWRLIYNVARESGLADVDAQEVVQDTVVAVARKIPEFRYDPAKGSFKQWLLLITRRRIHDCLRRLYRSERMTVSREANADETRPELPETAPSADMLIEMAWEREWRDYIFQAALDQVRQQVHPKHFQVFDCCVLQDLPPKRVARMLGLTASQVYLAKHRVSAAVKRAASEIETRCNRRPGT